MPLGPVIFAADRVSVDGVDAALMRMVGGGLGRGERGTLGALGGLQGTAQTLQ